MSKEEYKLRIVGGLDFYKVSSTFIKELGDHRTHEACFWAFVLLQSGYYKHVWKRLAIYANQLGGDQVIRVSALRNCFDLNTTAKDRKTKDGFCYICRAVVDLCGAKDEIEEITEKTIDLYCSGLWLETSTVP